MTPQIPFTRDLVLIGGGHTHALVLKKWGMNPLAGARVTLINPGPTAPYSGMLPGFVAGHYTRDELDIDLVRLARFAGARLIVGAVDGIDVATKTISVPGHGPIAYDVCAVDVGITSDMPTLPGFADHAIPAKPLGPFAAKWDCFRQSASDPHVAIIGGGVAGAELAMAMSHSLRQRGHEPTLHLIDSSRALSALGHTARRKMKDHLKQLGVTVIEEAEVTEITATGVKLGDGRTLRSDFTTGAAGAKPHEWQRGIAVEQHQGFIAVDRFLRSSDASLFAVGDCAHMIHDPRPKAGVYAVRQAPVLFDNLRAALSGGDLRGYAPQKDYLKLISLGEQKALAEKFGTARSGALLWKWKDHIDRKFMDQFDDLAAMAAPELPHTRALGVSDALGGKPLCGGCGAKVGRSALRQAVRMPAERDDIVAVPGDDAAMLKMGQVRQVISTDHLRSFIDDPVRMTRITAHHALGDIWAMGAKPQAALCTVILPRLSTALQERTLTEIMDTAEAVFDAAGAAIVGGHTSQGAELTLGFTVTGLCEGDPVTLAGAKPGDVLILTKPIGSGVILAGHMSGAARGADVLACLDAMEEGQGAASAILSGAHAMTDVTGFGLAGHLAGICAASGVGAELNLHDVPLFAGALSLSEGGTGSSLLRDNVAGAGPISGAINGPRAALLFDPQTAGGLLAAVPAKRADDLTSQLKKAGYTAAARIGVITDGPAGVHIKD